MTRSVAPRPTPRAALLTSLWALPLLLSAHASRSAEASTGEIERARLEAHSRWARSFELEAGETRSFSVRLPHPSRLPPDGRLRVRLSGPRADFAIEKVIHAYDPDVYLLYRAPRKGTYTLEVSPIIEHRTAPYEFASDTAAAAQADRMPDRTPWPDGAVVDVEIETRPLASPLTSAGITLETEPNDHPGLAVRVEFPAGDSSGDGSTRGAEPTVVIVGDQDDVDYFNNQGFFRGEGNDWYRVVNRTDEPRLLTANLQMVDPTVSSSLRFYSRRAAHPASLGAAERAEALSRRSDRLLVGETPDGGLIEVELNLDGKDPNERPHQQDDLHRSFITRRLDPGAVGFLRVEANQPGYELELRLAAPAPHDDLDETVRQGMYYQVAEVSAWMIHKPRGNARYRRIKDGTSLFGESCMSCHANSGIWSVAEATIHGHAIAPGTRMSWRRLQDQLYSCARPTNTLVDACVNTSTPPADFGDGLAGTRVAGRNMVLLEKAVTPKKLHAYQHLRAANYILQTNDPGAINAAGKGANFGPNVVFKFAGEILREAWDDTRQVKYLAGLEEKARKILDPENEKRNNAVCDDLGHRLEFAHRVWPRDYLRSVDSLLDDPEYLDERKAEDALSQARELDALLSAQSEKDLEHLLALQLRDGSWSFVRSLDEARRIDSRSVDRPGENPDPFQRTRRLLGHPAPTAVALIGLHAAGLPRDHEAVENGLRALQGSQEPQGLWRGGETGFVTTAYCLRALGHWTPGKSEPLVRRSFIGARSESLPDAVLRARNLAAHSTGELLDLIRPLIDHEFPAARYYALIGLGATPRDEHLPLIRARLGDPVKRVREAAHWALGQHLLDDRGWSVAFEAYHRGTDRERASVLRALDLKVDTTGGRSRILISALTEVLEKALLDPHPMVRAAAWPASRWWWVWTPDARAAINRAWAETLSRREPNALGRVARRFSTRAILQVNQFAGRNGYPELEELQKLLAGKLQVAAAPEREALEGLLTASAATYFQKRGANNVHQLRFGSDHFFTEAVGESALAELSRSVDASDDLRLRIAIEASSAAAHAELQARVAGILETGTLEQAGVAARALTSSSRIPLEATPERGLRLARRMKEFLDAYMSSQAEALATALSRQRWVFPETASENEPAILGFFENLLSWPPGSGSDARGTELDFYTFMGQLISRSDSLRRPELFSLVRTLSATPPQRHVWLNSLPWMLDYQSDAIEAGFEIRDAIEFEKLAVKLMTEGRIDRGLMFESLASGGEIIWWREHRPGARVVFEIPVPRAGRYELAAAFLRDPDSAIVSVSLDGETIEESRDLFHPFVSASGQVSLGVHEFEAGVARLELKNLGAHEDAKKETYAVGLDYVILRPAVDRSIEDIGRNERGRKVLDPLAGPRQLLADIYAASLGDEAPARSRDVALKLANDVKVRRNPWIRQALKRHLQAADTSTRGREKLERILEGDEKKYREELTEALVEERRTGDIPALDARSLSRQLEIMIGFKDETWVEMNRVLEKDQRSCLSCHGVPGRVPPLYLEPPEPSGYLSPPRLLKNYRKLEALVHREKPEASRFLRKPLNVQDGDEGSHQGGTRYEDRGDPGFKVLEAWVHRVAGRVEAGKSERALQRRF